MNVDVCSCIADERYISVVGFGDGERSLFMAISFHALVALDVVWSKLEKGREVGNVQGRRMRKRDFSADAKGCREACQRCFHETSSSKIKIPSILRPLAVVL